MEDDGFAPRSPLPAFQQQQVAGRKRPRGRPTGEEGEDRADDGQAPPPQQQAQRGANAGRQARMRVVVAAAIVAFFVGFCGFLPGATAFRLSVLRQQQQQQQRPHMGWHPLNRGGGGGGGSGRRGCPVLSMKANAKQGDAAVSAADIFDTGLPLVPSAAMTSARAAALARTSKYVAGAVDPGDDRETRPSAEGISDEEIDEVARKWEKRRAARRDRITKRKGVREAEIDEADDVVPVRDVPLWYALKVKIGMEIVLRDTLSQLASLPEYRGKILEVLVPMAKSVKSVGKQLRLVEQPLHRGYVFVQMAMDRDLYEAVLAPNGVGCFIGRRVPGKGIIPNPLRAKEADRLKERAVFEAGRTIDLDAIPFRPGDRVDVLQGEFAYSRGRVTSVKETELNVVVKRNNLEVRITLPHTSVRKLSQEELDQEARELGEEAVRSYNRARGGSNRADADAFTAIARSNAAALMGGDGKPLPQAPKKKAPEKRGPSLYRVLSDYVNLEQFDRNRPPVVKEMVQGMLELTGQREDVGGYYTQKFEMAKKAWEVWKQYLEEKEERRRTGREKALRRKTMGYDEFNDNWRPPSWTEGGNRGGERAGGGRGWDRGDRRRRDGGEEEDGGGWGANNVRGRGEEGEGGGDDDDLEGKFLDQLMVELDGPGAAKARAAKQAREHQRPQGQQRQQQRGWGASATIGDDEIEAVMSSPARPAPSHVAGGRGGEREGRGQEEGARGGGGGQGTLSVEEQRELDTWLGMVTSGKAAMVQEQAAKQEPQPPQPVGMGGQPRAVPPSVGKERKAPFSLDPAEEQELNEWLARFDADYAEEGSDGRKVVARKGGVGGDVSLPLPRPRSLDGTEGEDGLLRELLGGIDATPAKKRSGRQEEADVDRELAELLAKLEAAEAGDKGSGSSSSSGGAKPKARSVAAPVVADFDTLPSFDAPSGAGGKAGGGGVGGTRKRAASSWVDDDDDEDDEDEDDVLGGGRSKGGKARAPSKSGSGSRLFVRHADEEGEEDDDEDGGVSRMMRRNAWGSGRAGASALEEDVTSEGGTVEDEDDLHRGAYPLDPEDAPGQFIEEGLEDAVHMGRPRGGLGAGSALKSGFMFDDPLGGGAGGGEEDDSLLGAGMGVGPVGRRGAASGRGGRGLEALGEEDDDIFAGLGDLKDLEELEKLDKLFAEEAAASLGGPTKGKAKTGAGRGKGVMGGEEEEDDWSALLGGKGGDVDSLLKDLDLGGLDGLVGDDDDWGLGVGGGKPKGGKKGRSAAAPAAAAKAPKKAKAGEGKGGALSLSSAGIAAMKVADLKAELKGRGLPVTGTKGELQARLREATAGA